MPGARTASPVLLLILAACTPGRPTLLPQPDAAVPGTVYSFREWLPDGVPSFLEGTLEVDAHGYRVQTRQARCHEVPSLPTAVQREFDCGGVRLSFSREDPTLLALYRYTALVPLSSARCTGSACGSVRPPRYQEVPRSGRIQLTSME